MVAESNGVLVPVKSRFDAASLARSGFNVFAGALGLPADAEWEHTNKGAWETTAGAVIHRIEQAALTGDPLSFDSLAQLIAAWMGTDVNGNSTEERIAWGAVARLWANAIRTHDVDLFTIEQEALRYAQVKIDQSKPKPPPTPANPTPRFLQEAIDSVGTPPGVTPVTPEKLASKIEKITPGFATVVALQIQAYEQKIASLKALMARLNTTDQEALFDLMKTAIQGE